MEDDASMLDTQETAQQELEYIMTSKMTYKIMVKNEQRKRPNR